MSLNRDIKEENINIDSRCIKDDKICEYYYALYNIQINCLVTPESVVKDYKLSAS